VLIRKYPVEAYKIWESFHVELRNYVRRRTKDDATADDIVQEIFVKVLKNMERIEEVENIQEYLYAIARNTLIDSFRSRKLVLKEDYIENEALRENSLDGNSEDEVPASLNRIVSSCCVRPFIDKLPDKYREAIIASEINNESQKEMAERLNISYSGAKSRVQRGREKLKELLQQCCDFEYDSYGNLISSNSKNCNC